MTSERIDHHHERRSPTGRDAAWSLDAILQSASEHSRETIRVLGQLLGNQPLAVMPPAQFAIHHLGIDGLEIASTKSTGTSHRSHCHSTSRNSPACSTAPRAPTSRT